MANRYSKVNFLGTSIAKESTEGMENQAKTKFTLMKDFYHQLRKECPELSPDTAMQAASSCVLQTVCSTPLTLTSQFNHPDTIEHMTENFRENFTTFETSKKEKLENIEKVTSNKDYPGQPKDIPKDISKFDMEENFSDDDYGAGTVNKYDDHVRLAYSDEVYSEEGDGCYYCGRSECGDDGECSQYPY